MQRKKGTRHTGRKVLEVTINRYGCINAFVQAAWTLAHTSVRTRLVWCTHDRKAWSNTLIGLGHRSDL